MCDPTVPWNEKHGKIFGLRWPIWWLLHAVFLHLFPERAEASAGTGSKGEMVGICWDPRGSTARVLRNPVAQVAPSCFAVWGRVPRLKPPKQDVFFPWPLGI